MGRAGGENCFASLLLVCFSPCETKLYLEVSCRYGMEEGEKKKAVDFNVLKITNINPF